MSDTPLASALRNLNGPFFDSRVRINETDMPVPQGGPNAVPGVGPGRDVGPRGKSGLNLFGDETDETILGTDGKDVLHGGDGDDTIDGGGDNDNIKGNGGDDDLSGGDGDDNINGGTGDDMADGGDGDDLLMGKQGDDTLTGGAGDDKIWGGDGQDCAVFSGSILDYALSFGDDGEIYVTDLNTDDGDDGTDMLVEIEKIAFADYTYQTEGNNDPLIVATDLSTDEDTPIEVSIAVYDFDAGDSATLDLADYDGLGSFTMLGTETLSPGFGTGTLYNFLFDPTEVYDALYQDVPETDTLSLEASDSNGGFASRVIDLVITGVNDPPVANDDTASTDKDVAVNIDVLANDTDIDQGDVLSVLAGSPLAANGSVWIEADGTLTYTPDTGFFGEDTITYTVTDLLGATDTAQVTVTVNDVNAPPEPDAADDPEITAFTASGLITIDLNARVSDPNGDEVNIVSARLIDPATGLQIGLPFTLTDGLAQIDPAALGLEDGVVRALTIEYVAQDDSGEPNDTAIGFVDVIVTGGEDPSTAENAAPVAADFSFAADEADGPATIDFGPNVSDTDNDPLTIVAIFDAAGTEYVFEATGTSVTIDLQQFGLATGEADDFTLTYQVDDGTGSANAIGEGALTLSVTGADDPAPVNTPPVAGAVVQTANEADGDLVIDLGGSVNDPDGDAVSILSVAPPAGYGADSLTLIDGVLTLDTEAFGLDEGESEVFVFTYTAQDDSGAANATSEGTITLTINGSGTTEPPATSYVLDFESNSAPDPSSTQPIQEAFGFRFGGVATVIETDELGDRGGAGFVNGQTTTDGFNVLAAASSFVTVPVIDPETGLPVEDDRGDVVTETLLEDIFAIYAQGSTYMIGDTIATAVPVTAGSPPPPLPDPLPEPLLGGAYGTSFDLNGLSLNVTGGAGQVEIITYTLGTVTEPNEFQAGVDNVLIQLVEVDSFVFDVDSETSALEIDFEAETFAGLASGETSNMGAFDDIYAVSVNALDPAQTAVLDDILITG